MQNVTVDIELYDVKLQVTGNYTKGTPAILTYGSPEKCTDAEPGEFEVETVCIGGMDVTNFMSNVNVQARVEGTNSVNVMRIISDRALESAEEAGLRELI